MTDDRWKDVDEYFERTLVKADPALDAALAASDEAGLPRISVAPNQGKLLHLLALACRARSVLEIGALGGYSTLWLARAVGPAGRCVTIERNAHHADVARRNIARAGLEDVVDIRVGAAVDVLATMAAEGTSPFDLVFIDADKPNTPAYFDRAVTMTRRGGLIVVDNVVRRGRLVEADCEDENVRAMRQLCETIAADARVSATGLQTVGVKGYDGFVLAVVIDGA